MYGLIGKKIGHSFSADFFNKKFQKEGIDESYHLFPLDSIKQFPQLLENHKDLKGLNVTIPYKIEVIPYLNILSDEAAEIGAVNVIKIENRGGEKFLSGYNSDSIGFKESLIPLLRPDIKKALVLGTGGASKAVVYALKQLGITYTNVSRTPKMGHLSYEELDSKVIKDNLLIVNTTPLGMYPDIDSFPPIPYEYITPEHVCYDLVYNPDVTTFMKKAMSQGAKATNGLEMLRLQALAAWDIWNG